MHKPVTTIIFSNGFHFIQADRHQAFSIQYSPKNHPRPHRNPRKHLHGQNPAAAERMVPAGIRAPTAPSVQQAPKADCAVRGAEDGDQDVDEQVEEEGSGRFVRAQAAEVVGGEEEGEDCLVIWMSMTTD